MRETVNVDLGDRSYSIEIGNGLLKKSGALVAPFLKRSRVAIVTDETVAGHHLEALKKGLSAVNIDCAVLSLPAGETTKSWTHLEQTVEWLLAEKIERDDMVLAFGGGVIGDLVGFAAAIMRRGVDFIQIPTTLLAQVDSSVGGKTAINSKAGKNLIGAFYQPRLVLADIDLLGTLSERDFLAGYGEVVKYGLLGDEGFFAWLEENGPKMRDGDQAARIHAVKRSCEMKAEIVAEDEKEHGRRALLNLGHTFCHALEAATGYSDRLLHGEGVAIGCALAFQASMKMGLCSQEDPSRVRAHLKDMGMKSDLSDIPGELPNADGLIDLMYQDKKVQDGKIAFILAEGIGKAFVSRDADLDVVRAVLTAALDAR
ncbi:MAG: 3-dehydroquinate synthase [Pseudomonadota bacterium]